MTHQYAPVWADRHRAAGGFWQHREAAISVVVPGKLALKIGARQIC